MFAHSGRRHGRRRTPHRYLVSPLILIVLAIASACAGPDESPTSAQSPTAQSPTVTPSAPGADWAESVCSAANDVRSSLDAIGSNLTIDRSADAGALEQVKTTLNTQVAAARTSVTELRTAIEAVPADKEGAEELKSSLSNARGSLQEDVQAVSASVADAQAATTAQDFVKATAQTLQELETAKSSAEAFVPTAKQAATKAGGDLKAAFDAAPSCGEPSASPS
jgi:hypothetical protein